MLPEDEAIALLRGSYDLVKAKLPQKLQKQIDATAAPKQAAPKKAAAKKKAAKKKARD